MQGKIADFGIPEIFQLVTSQQKSGALTILGDERETIFLFSEGKIVDVQPDRHKAPSTLIGNILVDAGYLTTEELQRILALQEKEKKKIGEILVEKGKISREALAQYLNLQVKDSLYFSLRIREGDYRFEVFAVRPPAWMATPTRGDRVLMEGMQFLDEYALIREKFPPERFKVVRKWGVKIDPMVLPSQERVVWGAVYFSSDPYQVFRKACLTWHEGLKALWGLWDRGLVEISPVDMETQEAGRAILEDIARRFSISCVRAAIWSVAAIVAGIWLNRILFSSPASHLLAGWAEFYR